MNCTFIIIFFILGRPIFNSVAYVLDKEMQPVPLDTIGQLYISSANLCDGYVGTKHKNFMPNKVCTLMRCISIAQKQDRT